MIPAASRERARQSRCCCLGHVAWSPSCRSSVVHRGKNFGEPNRQHLRGAGRPLWRRDRRSNSKMVSRRFSQDLQTAHKIQGSRAIYSKRLQKHDPGTLQPCDRDPEPEPEKRLGLLMMSETSRSTSAKEMSLGPLELGGRAMANGIAGRWYMALIFNKAPIRLPWQPLHPDLVINSMESAEGRRCKKAGLRLDRQRSLLSSAPGLNSTPPRQWSWPAGRRPRLRRTDEKPSSASLSSAPPPPALDHLRTLSARRATFAPQKARRHDGPLLCRTLPD